jgi:hypothetical protein
MTKLTHFWILAAALAPAALFAQTPPGASAFQQPGWFHNPSNGSSFHTDTLVGQSGPVMGKPLSAEEVHRNEQILSDGSRIDNSETNHFYRDSQGRMRTETATGAVIYDPTTGYTYDLTFGSKSYTKSAVKPGSNVMIAARAHQSGTSSWSGNRKGGTNKSGNGPASEDLSPQFVNGIFARGSRSTSTIPAGAIGNDRDLKIVNESWFSEDLKLLLKSSNSDPRFGTTTYELRNITQAEPDSSLFQVPSDYTLGH